MLKRRWKARRETKARPEKNAGRVQVLIKKDGEKKSQVRCCSCWDYLPCLFKFRLLRRFGPIDNDDEPPAVSDTESAPIADVFALCSYLLLLLLLQAIVFLIVCVLKPRA